VLVPAALRRPGLLVFVVVSLLYLPMLGAYGLWDPWETHYGEVAREILARDDWISLWWAQDRWFWSKPILIFWMEALSWGALGMPFEADSNPAHPEWAIRLPHYILTMAALMACRSGAAWNTEAARSRPFCRSPISTLGASSDGAS
jgi:4-amino-4-deoxy-L-arabinose transferase-like glycosyltransferase